VVLSILGLSTSLLFQIDHYFIHKPFWWQKQ
jgi:hypothetical protein